MCVLIKLMKKPGYGPLAPFWGYLSKNCRLVGDLSITAFFVSAAIRDQNVNNLAHATSLLPSVVDP